MPDLLAAVEHGNLDKNNVDANTGLAVFLSRLPIYYENRLKAGKGPIPGDHIDDPDHYGDWENYNLVYGEWQTSLDVKPLIKTHWHQKSPFNDQAPLINGDTAYAGCTNIAFAQLIAFHRKPNRFRGLTLDWELLTNQKKACDHPIEYRSMVASLCRKIGDATNTTWGTRTHRGGSGASEKMIPKVLSEEMGYSSPSKVEKYNSSSVLGSLEEKNPVPIVLVGYEEKIPEGWWIFKWEAYKSGHTWLMDFLSNIESFLYTKRKPVNLFRQKTNIGHFSIATGGGDRNMMAIIHQESLTCLTLSCGAHHCILVLKKTLATLNMNSPVSEVLDPNCHYEKTKCTHRIAVCSPSSCLHTKDRMG